MSKLFSELVGESLGRASMAWSETPIGIFDSDTCCVLHIDIMNAHNEELKKLQAENAKLEKKLSHTNQIMDAMTKTSQYNFKLQAENDKLKECVEFYGEVFNWRDSGQDYGHGTIKPDDKEDLSEDDRVRLFGGKRARQVLKELEEE